MRNVNAMVHDLQKGPRAVDHPINSFFNFYQKKLFISFAPKKIIFIKKFSNSWESFALKKFWDLGSIDINNSEYCRMNIKHVGYCFFYLISFLLFLCQKVTCNTETFYGTWNMFYRFFSMLIQWVYHSISYSLFPYISNYSQDYVA